MPTVYSGLQFENTDFSMTPYTYTPLPPVALARPRIMRTPRAYEGVCAWEYEHVSTCNS